GRAYIEAARLSELVFIARQKLGEADERAKRLPFDMAEAQLRMMRETLAHAEIDKLHPEQRYSAETLDRRGIADLIRKEMSLRHQIASARELLTIDPEAALRQLNALGPDFTKLETGVQLTGIVENLWELLAAASGALSTSGGLGAIFTGGE